MTDAALPRGCDRPLTQAYDVALVDLDGVVYVGESAVEGAAEALRRARCSGMRLAFVTNNASRTPAAVASHLRQVGVAAVAEDVVTSAQAAARLVADRVPAGANVLVVGGEGLVVALAEHGLRAVHSADDEPAAVAQGFAPEVDWVALAEAAVAVGRGLPWVASNLDRTIPTPRGTAPGNGSLVAAVAAATGREPVAAGKPELPLHREAAIRTGARNPLVVGDRLDTDIDGAVRAGSDSLLVLTGVTSVSELLAAPPRMRPTYVAPDLGGLLVAHPAVRSEGDGWRCGAWWAVVEERTLRLEPDAQMGSDSFDGLRATCAAVWGSGRDVDSATAVSRLAL